MEKEEETTARPGDKAWVVETRLFEPTLVEGKISKIVTTEEIYGITTEGPIKKTVQYWINTQHQSYIYDSWFKTWVQLSGFLSLKASQEESEELPF